MNDIDKFVLETALKKISLVFDEFISACVDDNGKAIAPSNRAIAQAKAFLPEYCKNSYSKKPKPNSDNGIHY